MKISNLIYFLTLLFAIISCNLKEDEIGPTLVKSSASDSILISKSEVASEVSHKFNSLTFTFSKPSDPYDLGLYHKLAITRNDSSIFEIENDLLELEGRKFGANIYSNIHEEERTLYLIEINNRPEPNYFLILSNDNQNSINLLGKSSPITADTIADIDNDGLLEIVGFNTYCQAATAQDLNNPTFCMDYFRVFEINDTIARDSITEAAERLKLIKK